jgi:D-3-phosphoglycerate dehydrogenase
MAGKKVVVTDYTFPDLPQERAAAEGAGAEFSAHQTRTAEAVVDAVRGAQVVAVQFAPFTRDAIAALAPGASVIRYGVGYDNIDLAAAREAGVAVGYVPDYCTEEVADHTSASILTLLRKLVPLDASVRAGQWTAVAVARPIRPFAETEVGFFGFGQIGRAVHQRLRAFGFRFKVFDPALTPDDATALGIKLAGAEELFAECDIVSLHAPANKATIDFVDMERLKTMRPSAFIVNAARGQLIVEEDIAEALKKGIIAGAALDVFHKEPLPADSPLRDAPNLLLTPHAAWYSDAAIGRLQGLVAEDISRALAGRPLRKPVPMG